VKDHEKFNNDITAVAGSIKIQMSINSQSQGGKKATKLIVDDKLTQMVSEGGGCNLTLYNSEPFKEKELNEEEYPQALSHAHLNNSTSGTPIRRLSSNSKNTEANVGDETNLGAGQRPIAITGSHLF